LALQFLTEIPKTFGEYFLNQQKNLFVHGLHGKHGKELNFLYGISVKLSAARGAMATKPVSKRVLKKQPLNLSKDLMPFRVCY
jgi:hypothetical protein